LYIIGRGGFGKVWKVRLKNTNEYFALKEMFKVKVIDKRSEFSIMSERNLLSRLKHPFIVNMHFAFQDFSKLYLVMDLLTGGDLRYHIAKVKTFTEAQTKFFLANLIISLEYIHSQKIIHRDIKPENLVLDSKGYASITDFGVAKINEADNSSETSGTPGYMAPEVILIQNHSYPCDFFALGVIGYEFMKGYRPYLGRSRKEIKELILAKQAKIRKEELPEEWTPLAAEFINALLQRKPSKRLGYKNIEEIKKHPWMKDIDWDLLAKKKLKSPFLLYINKENFDKEYCEGDEKIGDQTLERYEEYTQSECFEGLFENYTYMDLGDVDNYQKKYGKIKDETKINNKIYNKTNYNVNSNLLKDENFKTISLNKDTKNSLSNKSFHSHHNSPKIANIKIITNYINNSKKNKFKIKDLIEKDNHKEFINPNYNSNEGIKVLSQNNSKKKIAAKETAFDLLKNKEQFKNIILKSILGNNNKEKKIKKEREDKISLSKIQKILMKNGRKINFNLTKKIFLNKSNSVKLVKPTNPNDLIHYNNYISNKKDEQTSGSPLTKNLMDLKNINKNGDFKTALLQQYLKNKNINSNKLNILLNKDRLNNKNQPLKRKKHRNNSQIEGEDFSKKVMTLLNNKEKTKDKNNKKEELKRYKNLFLNPNTNLYNIMTLNKNKSKNFHKNINSPTTNGDNSKHFSSTNNINNNIKRKTNKDNETIINQFYHPKLTINNRLKKNKIYNYLSNLNIHGKNNMQIYKKFPFVYNLNTISNSPKNMLTINLDDSYTKNIIKGKVINIHNHNFLTSNNIRSQKNIRNIIVNNISPTVNVLIHNEARKSLKNKKSKGQKRVNSNNNKSKTNKNNDNYITDNESKIKYRRKQFNDSKKKYQKKDSLN
jgi:serine/threonine protein kinase